MDFIGFGLSESERILAQKLVMGWYYIDSIYIDKTNDSVIINISTKKPINLKNDLETLIQKRNISQNLLNGLKVVKRSVPRLKSNQLINSIINCRSRRNFVSILKTGLQNILLNQQLNDFEYSYGISHTTFSIEKNMVKIVIICSKPISLFNLLNERLPNVNNN